MKKYSCIAILALSFFLTVHVWAANTTTDPVLNSGNGPASGAIVGGTSGNGPASGGLGGGNSGNGPASGGLTQPSSGNSPASGGVSGNSSRLSIAGLVSWFLGLLNYAVQIIIALALIAFLYGIFRLVFLDASNTTEREKARKFMIWGISALFVMVSVWGLVNVLKTTVFGGGALIIPTFR